MLNKMAEEGGKKVLPRCTGNVDQGEGRGVGKVERWKRERERYLLNYSTNMRPLYADFSVFL